MDGLGTSIAADTVARDGTRMACPAVRFPLLRRTALGLYHASCFAVSPCRRAMDVIDSPFFVSTRVTALRAAGSSKENRSAKPAPAPAGTRTHSDSPGGDMPRRMRGFKSRIDAMSVGDALATASNAVAPGTRTESAAHGGTESTATPYRAGSFPTSAAAMSFGT